MHKVKDYDNAHDAGHFAEQSTRLSSECMASNSSNSHIGFHEDLGTPEHQQAPPSYEFYAGADGPKADAKMEGTTRSFICHELFNSRHS